MILLIIDAQVGFLKHENHRRVALGIVELQKEYPAVVATVYSGDGTFKSLMNRGDALAERMQSLYPGIRPDFVVSKYSYNAVTPSFVQLLIHANGGSLPEEVHIVGADTDCCVLTTATALYELNIRPVVLKDYCWSTGGEDAHKAGLTCLKRLIGSAQVR